MNLFKYIFLLSLLLLASCNRSYSYDYLMTHPAVLETEYQRCETQADLVCSRVKQAAKDFTALLDQRNKDPERWGQQIMMLQADPSEQHTRRLQILYAVLATSSPG